MSADWLFGTVEVAMGKLALVAPAGTVTLAGTVAATVSSLESATRKPPAGAAEVSLTVPVELVPPTRSLGLTTTVDSDGATTVVEPPPPVGVFALAAVAELIPPRPTDPKTTAATEATMVRPALADNFGSKVTMFLRALGAASRMLTSRSSALHCVRGTTSLADAGGSLHMKPSY
jgi:hypothetical protein